MCEKEFLLAVSYYSRQVGFFYPSRTSLSPPLFRWRRWVSPCCSGLVLPRRRTGRSRRPCPSSAAPAPWTQTTPPSATLTNGTWNFTLRWEFCLNTCARTILPGDALFQDEESGLRSVEVRASGRQALTFPGKYQLRLSCWHPKSSLEESSMTSMKGLVKEKP